MNLIRLSTKCLAIAAAALSLCLAPQAAEIDVTENLPADPHVAGAYTFDPVEMLESWIGQFGAFTGTNPDKLDEFYLEMDEKFGMSFRDDVLAPLGPNFGFALTLPPYDQLMAEGTSVPDLGSAQTFEGFVLVIGYRDRERAVRALGALVNFADGTLQVTADGVLVRLGKGDDGLTLHGRISDSRIVLAGSPERASSAIGGFASSSSLADGADFSLVSGQVDAGAESMTYMNLPKVRTWLEDGGGAEKMGEEINAFLTDAWMGTGAIHASTRVAGGIRTTRFGPEALNGIMSPFSGGAMMVPMLLRFWGEVGNMTSTPSEPSEPQN